MPDRPPLKLGTRASPLAMAQAHEARDRLCAAYLGLKIEIVPVTASGDKVLDRPLAEIGGKALWTKELDAWLLAGEIDFAVHSLKDVETIRPDGIAIAAILPREDVRDVLVGAASLAELVQRLGVISPRDMHGDAVGQRAEHHAKLEVRDGERGRAHETHDRTRAATAARVSSSVQGETYSSSVVAICLSRKGVR